jgi:hypothetical protein
VKKNFETANFFSTRFVCLVLAGFHIMWKFADQFGDKAAVALGLEVALLLRLLYGGHHGLVATVFGTLHTIQRTVRTLSTKDQALLETFVQMEQALLETSVQKD